MLGKKVFISWSGIILVNSKATQTSDKMKVKIVLLTLQLKCLRNTFMALKC